MDRGKSDKITVHEVVSVTVRTDVPAPPPPPGFTSPFKSLKEWLFYLCDSEKAEKFIADLQFCVMTSGEDYILSVDGFNEYSEEDVVAYRIEFHPEHSFFPLPPEHYKNMLAEEVQKQVLNEFDGFLKTEKFKTSFMAKAESIKLNFQDGEYYRLK